MLPDCCSILLQSNIDRLFTVLSPRDHWCQIVYSILLQKCCQIIYSTLILRSMAPDCLQYLLSYRAMLLDWLQYSPREQCCQIAYKYSTTSMLPDWLQYSPTEQCCQIVYSTLIQRPMMPNYLQHSFKEQCCQNVARSITVLSY